MTYKWNDETVQLRNKKTRSPGFFKDPSDKKASATCFAPKSLPGRSISARIFPNGEFGVGFVPQRGISAKERRYDEDIRYAEMNAEIVADIEVGEQYPEGFIYTRKIIPGSPPKLGTGAKSSQRPAKYGKKGITSYGRKMLRNAGYLIDRACEDKYNRFPQMGTLTIPSYSETTMRLIAANWGDIVRKFFQECKRRYARFCYRFDYASCTEIQPGRWAESREVGLHIHFLFVAIRLGKSVWVLPDSFVREVWGRILGHYLADGDTPQLPNYRREPVRKSSAAYLAKYASKGCDITKEVLEEKGEQFLPSQWWSVSSGIRAGVRRYTILSTGVLAEKLLVISRWGVSDYIKYIRCITLQVAPNDYAKARGCPEEIVLGYGGMLSLDGFRLFSFGNHFEDISKVMPFRLGRKHRYFKKCHSTRLTVQP